MVVEYTGKLVLIIGPSGCGKGTMMNLLKEKHPEFIFPISATTRKIRAGEENGVQYYFLTKEEFEKKIKIGDFIEYSINHNIAYYGVLKEPILEGLKNAKTMIKEVDYKGCLSFKKIISNQNLKTLFILPPKENILIKRIKERAAISDEELDNRLNSIRKEVEVANQCDVQLNLIDGDINGSYKLFEKEILNLIKT